MDYSYCPNCGTPITSDAFFCQRCGMPLCDVLDSHDAAECLTLATGRKWIAIAEKKDLYAVLMEKEPIAIIGYGAPFDDWEHSPIRELLNGSFLASLPEWVTDRLINVRADNGSIPLIDKVVILSEWEADILLEGAPHDRAVVNLLANLENLQARDRNAAASFEAREEQWLEDGRDDPLSAWRDDPRQYLSEEYDEWASDYDQVLKDQEDWFEKQESRWDSEVCEWRELEYDRWRFSMRNAGSTNDARFEWTREGLMSVNNGDFLDSRNVESEDVFAVRPVICVRLVDKDSNVNKRAVDLSKAARLLPKWSKGDFEKVIAFSRESKQGELEDVPF